MAKARRLYCSPNGDRWNLTRDGSGEVFVQHEANPASGGHVANIEIETFLGSGRGPEQQELLRLIGTLVNDGTAQASVPPAGPHDVPELVDPLATPGTGVLPPVTPEDDIDAVSS
jgi:hypothetical protein